MTIDDIASDWPDKTVTIVFNPALSSLVVRWKNNYSDADEADFFGDQAEPGELMGFTLHGACNYKSSEQETTHIATGTTFLLGSPSINGLRSARLECRSPSGCPLTISLEFKTAELEYCDSLPPPAR